jgi:hypothetical protein
VHAADYSTPSAAKVNNQWSYTSIHLIDGMHWHYFTFTLTNDQNTATICKE